MIAAYLDCHDLLLFRQCDVADEWSVLGVDLRTQTYAVIDTHNLHGSSRCYTPTGVYASGGLESLFAGDYLGSGNRTKARPDTRVFSSCTRTWTAQEPMAVPRSRHASVSIGSDIYILGGDVGGTPGGSQTASCAKWRSETRKWEPLPPMRKAHEQMRAAVCGESIFMWGRGSAAANDSACATECGAPSVRCQDSTWPVSRRSTMQRSSQSAPMAALIRTRPRCTRLPTISGH